MQQMIAKLASPHAVGKIGNVGLLLLLSKKEERRVNPFLSLWQKNLLMLTTKEGSRVQKLDSLHKVAQSNRSSFLRYRWW